MSTTNPQQTSGCGGQACQCSGRSQIPKVTINGIAINEVDIASNPDMVIELAHSELLRQNAVSQGLLPRHKGLEAPELTPEMRSVIEDMVEREVVTPKPTDEECARYYASNKRQFVQGQAMHVRHILFAVTSGVNVHALSLRAEQALLELSRKDVPADRFAQLAADLSNCPSSAHGGDLGWIGPQDCAPELANELFHQTDPCWSMGVHPRLVHTRFGFHIVEVLGRRHGKQAAYAEVAAAVRLHLQQRCRATALRQYMLTLIGRAQIEGIELEGAKTPLVQ